MEYSESNTSSCMITPMKYTDVEDVVTIHYHSFPGFFLTFLGKKFLRLLYSEILRTPGHVAFVSRDHRTQEVTGFVVGVTQQQGFYKRVARQRWLAFALASLPAVARRPMIVPRLFRALTYSKTLPNPTAALLMSIAVSREMAGKGVGQQLIRCFLKEMQSQEVPTVSLTTDHDNNERANRFYQQVGFSLAQTYVTAEGRKMNEYIVELAKWQD